MDAGKLSETHEPKTLSNRAGRVMLEGREMTWEILGKIIGKKIGGLW